MSVNDDSVGRIISTNRNSERSRRKADNESKRSQMKGWEATARIIGDPTIKSKKTCTLEHCGSKLNGDWRISSVRHEFMGNRYISSLKLVRPEAGQQAANTSNKTDNSDSRTSDNGVAVPESDNDTVEINVG